MNEKNTKLLLKKYPKIFEDHNLPITESAMGWLFECGDGWFQIIDILCSEIDCINKNYIKNASIKASQVKEKFGGLRYYYHIEANDKQKGAKYDEVLYNKIHSIVDGLTRYAEALSYRTCEDCGSTKDITQNKKGWIKTLCSKCYKDEK